MVSARLLSRARVRALVPSHVLSSHASRDHTGPVLAHRYGMQDPLATYQATHIEAFPPHRVLAVAAAAAAEAGTYECVAKERRLRSIHHSFHHSLRTGGGADSEWDGAVLQAWCCYERLRDGEGEQVLVFRNHTASDSAHARNALNLQLRSDLSFRVYSCGQLVTMPPDSPNHARLTSRQAITEVLQFLLTCCPCSGGPTAVEFQPFLEAHQLSQQQQQRQAGAQPGTSAASDSASTSSEAATLLQWYQEKPQYVHLPAEAGASGAAAAAGDVVSVHPSRGCHGLISALAFSPRCPCCTASHPALRSAIAQLARRQAAAAAAAAAAAGEDRREAAEAEAQVAGKLAEVLERRQLTEARLSELAAETRALAAENAALRAQRDQRAQDAEALMRDNAARAAVLLPRLRQQLEWAAEEAAEDAEEEEDEEEEEDAQDEAAAEEEEEEEELQRLWDELLQEMGDEEEEDDEEEEEEDEEEEEEEDEEEEEHILVPRQSLRKQPAAVPSAAGGVAPSAGAAAVAPAPPRMRERQQQLQPLRQPSQRTRVLPKRLQSSPSPVKAAGVKRSRDAGKRTRFQLGTAGWAASMSG